MFPSLSFHQFFPLFLTLLKFESLFLSIIQSFISLFPLILPPPLFPPIFILFSPSVSLACIMWTTRFIFVLLGLSHFLAWSQIPFRLQRVKVGRAVVSRVFVHFCNRVRFEFFTIRYFLPTVRVPSFGVLSFWQCF